MQVIALCEPQFEELGMKLSSTAGVPDQAVWLAASRDEIRHWIANRATPLIVGWPFNGTRRWHLQKQHEAKNPSDYLSTLIRRQAEQHALVLNLGATAVVAPGFGDELLQRGEAYVHSSLAGLLSLADDAVYQDLFAQGVRMRFYGDYRQKFAAPPYTHWLAACDQIMAATSGGAGPIIFMGLFADKPYTTIAALCIEFNHQHGRPPVLDELRELYYGVPMTDLSVYIGFEQPSVFDVPLLTTGLEDVYVTLNPSPDVSEAQLRAILYDHLFLRRIPDVDYQTLSAEQQQVLLQQMSANHGQTFGLGLRDSMTGLWRPDPNLGST